MAPSGGRVEPVAIIGLSFKFAGDAVDAESFWHMVTEGRCAAGHIPESRFAADHFFHPDTNRLYALPTRDGYFLKGDIAAFDAPFFSITAAEAAAMDPQSRALLETTYRALENAGIPIEKCAGTETSVHIGCSSDDYRMMYVKDTGRPIRHAATGMAISMLANKVSWFYDITGPSITLDTACSASLNALHLSCESLRSGDSSMGLVGGVNLFFTPESMSPLAHLNFFSPDGRCYSFDHRANGYARGEGFGVVVIKRLADALADNDPIRAIIRATGSNENGRTVGGITQVSCAAQESLIRKTYSRAMLDFGETRYVEAHGPGTGGDPIEAAALAAVFSDFRNYEDPLYLGSCKANVGHLEGGSGIAALIKTILVLEQGMIPRLANFQRLNPQIDADRYHFKYPTENVVWPPGLRRASVNSFGFGGSNSHVVIEDAYHHLKQRRLHGNHTTTIMPTLASGYHTLRSAACAEGNFEFLRPDDVPAIGSQLLVFSASDERGLERNMQAFAGHAQKMQSEVNDPGYLQSLAYTLAIRRSHLKWRQALIVNSLSDLCNSTFRVARRKSLRNVTIGFVFTGQGAQFAQMGLGLLKYETFRASLQRCQSALYSLGCTWDLIDELARTSDDSNIQKPEYSQALTTCLQIALVDLLIAFGIKPSANIGHSSGEIAAAYSYGALSLPDACKIAYFRGLYANLTAQAHEPCGMMVVGLGPEQAEQHLNGMRKHISDLRVCIACINSPKNVTLSGLTKHLDVLKEHLDESSVFVQKLKVTLAYHSPDMTAIAEGYRLAIGNLGPSSHNSDSKFYSTSVMKEVTTEDLCKADYWVNNLLSPVQFAPVLTRMCQSKHETDSKSSARLNALVEIGPHSALRVPIQQTLDTLPKVADIVYYSAQTRDADGNNALLQLLGSLHCHGYPVALDKEGSFGKNTICLTNLPEYSFDHSRSYWHESRLSKNFRFRKYPTSDLLGARVTDWNPLEGRWRNIISTLENPWIEDHRINGTLLYPGAGQLVMAIEAVAQYAQDFDERQPAGFRLRDVVFLKPLNISLSPEGVETQISLRPLREAADRSVGWSEFKICVYEGDEWAETCHGQVIVEYDESENEVSKGREKRDKAAELRKRYLECSSRCTRQVSNEKVYRRLNDYGLGLGPTFKVFDDIRYSNERETTSKIKLRQWTLRGNPQHSQPYFIHPTALDGVFQLGIAALANCGNDDVPTMVPSRIGKLWLSAVGLSGENTTSLKGCAKSEYRGYRETHMDILALDQTAESPRVVVDGLETIIIGSKGDKQKPRRRLCYKMVWKPVAMEDVRQNGESNYAEQILLRDKEHIIIVAEQTKLQQDLAIGVKRLLTGQVSSCSILSLEGAARVSTRTPKLYIFLIDLDQFCLSQMDEASFLSLKHIVSSTKFILWVYPYPQYLRSPNAKLSGSIQGLARTLRLEYSELKFILAGLKMDSSAVGVAATIIDVLQRSLSVTDERCETEYLQINGKLTVSRLTTDHELDEIITRRAQGMQHEMRAFGSHAALKLSIETPGLLDTLQFEEDQAVATPLLAHEIEVKPEYCGLNFMDCLVALGRVPQASLGVECAGIVLRAGDDSDLLPGDRVVLCASGTIKSVVRCHYRTAIRIPNNMPLQEAAALPATTATVYQALYNVAHLQAGETILIHAGAGATGQMAIQFAAVLGAVVYVTVGSDEKKQLILDQYQIPKDHIFYSRNAEFADGIHRITDGRGVDVVLNSLAGDSLVASWECIAPFGRFVEIGKRDIYAHKQLPMFPFAKNVTFSAVDLAGIWEDCPALMRQILKAVVEMADSKQISVATPLHIYPVSKIEAAFRLLQSGKNIGKVVLEMDKSSQVPMCLKMRTEYQLQNNATYIVSGGLGGLGKSAAKWLVTRGARYLLLLSKSGPKTDADSAFIRELEATGAHIAAPSCDITDLAELSNILDRHATDMPPIRGCIQGAMVLRDQYFTNMNHSEWRQSLAPKVNGSWHLHSLLPKGMDFYIFLSSMRGVIGGQAQANYTAGNTFMDALARHRVTTGEKAVSLDLSIMLSEGVLAENDKLMRALESEGFYIPMTQGDFHSLLDQYCDPRLPVLQPDDAQVVLGLEMPLVIRARGSQEPTWMRQPLFAEMWSITPDSELLSSTASTHKKNDIPFQELFNRASSLVEAGSIVAEALAKKLSESLVIPVSEVDPGRPLHFYGVDSLVAVELRNWFAKELHADVAIFEILGNRGYDDLGAWAATRSGFNKFGTENEEGGVS